MLARDTNLIHAVVIGHFG